MKMSHDRTRSTEQGAIALLVCIALLGALIVSAPSAAAPVYTDWSQAVNLGPVVNSTSPDAGPALSADGLSLYFYSGRPGGVGSDDIWVSHRGSAADAWGPPADLGAPIDSTARDFVPAFSPDGHWMFFASDRAGGYGGPDLYESYRADVHDDFGWGTPTNLGAGVNSAAADNGNGYFENGGHPQLYFGSDRIGPAGSADLYVSDLMADGTWGTARLVPELNSTATENRPTLRQDGLEIFFYSARAGSIGSSDIWTSTRSSVDAPWSTPVDLGSAVNTSASEVHPYLSADAESLIFSSAQPGGTGMSDLYVTTRSQVLPTTKDDCKRGGYVRFGIFKNQGDCVSYVATDGSNQAG
jgi:hypothetical protein